MNAEISFLAERILEAYEGQPWFGRNIKNILSEVDESIAFEKLNGQHSIVELLWHMITWREFVLSRFEFTNGKPLSFFEEKDWRQLDYSDKKLWRKGLQQFEKIQNELIQVIRKQNDTILSQQVRDRNYDFRKLLYGIIEHDIYHIGQIAYIKKLLGKKKDSY